MPRPLLTIEQRPLFHVDDEERARPRRAHELARVVVGAPPILVEAGAPGARDEVRAYAERVRSAWRGFWEADVVPWAKSAGFGDVSSPAGGIVIGDVIDGTPEERAKWKANADLLARFANDRSEFEAYRGQISGFDLLGPTASEAWQKLFLYETALKADRASLSAKRKLVSPDPGALEEPGGIAGGLGQIPWKWIAGGAIALGVGLAASSAARIVRG